MATTKYVLSDSDIAVINAARSIIGERFGAYPESVDDGKLSALANVAGDALFNLLNWYMCHGGGAVSEDQLYNRVESAA